MPQFPSFVAALVALLLVSFGASSAETPAAPVTLKPAVTVEDARIRLGDLFLGVDRNADVVVAAAPTPGERITLNANFLLRVAQAYKLNWRPMSNLDRVTVMRSSQLLERHRIEALLREQLAKEGMTGDLDIELEARPNEIQLPSDAED